MNPASSSSASGSYSSGLGRSDPVARADEVTAELLSLNGLQYVSKDTSLSLVTSRTQKRFDAVQSTVSAGGTLNYRLDAGSQFLNPRTSWIQFKIHFPVPNAVEVMLGNLRSAFNLLDTYRFNHSSGVEIEHVEDYNTWSNLRNIWSNTEEYQKSVASLYCQQENFNAGITSTRLGPITTVPLAGGEIMYQDVPVFIPLYLLSDMFRQNVMLPPWLIAGSLLQFTLAEGWKAFISSAAQLANASAYTITEAQIVLDLYTLTDGTVRALSDLSASAGLDIDFTSVWQVNQFTASANTVVSTTKALSQASAVHTLVRPQPSLEPSTGYIVDCFASAVNAGGDGLGSGGYYITLGSLFMPQQPITTIQQLYSITKQCWNMFNERPTNPRSLNEFKIAGQFVVPGLTWPVVPGAWNGAVAYDPADCRISLDAYNTWITKTPITSSADNSVVTYTTKGAYMPCQLFSYLLERSMILASSCAISSQRSLQVVLNMNLVQVGSGWRVSVFTEYQKVVSVFLDSCIVRS
jgi:hypothetical protein